MKAAIHFGPDFLTNSEVYKNTKFEKIWSVFNMTQKLIKDHAEGILNVECLEYSSPSWINLANDKAVKLVKARVCVHADSLLCVGQVKDISLIESEWTIIFQGFSSLSLLREIENDLGTKNIKLQDFKDRIIFMLMLMTLYG